MNWLCNNIQTAFFLSSESEKEALELWDNIIGGEPAMFFKDTNPNPMNYPGAILGGPCNNFSILLGLQKTRLDLWITPLGTPNNNDLPPSLSSTNSALDLLLEKSKLIAREISYNRIGIIANLAMFFDIEEDVVSEFNKKLGSATAIPKNSKEANIRYNAVTNECIEDFNFTLNSINSLSIFKHRNINLQISDGSVPATTTSTKEYFGLGRGIDINIVKLKNPVSEKHSDELIDLLFAKTNAKISEE